MINNVDRVGSLLQATLVELIDLAQQGKQAHWNVVGPRFLPVHQQLDTLVDDVRLGADEVAERAVAVGYRPDGRSATVAKETPLSELPAGSLADVDVVREITDRLRNVADSVRARVDQLDDLDPVTQDLLIGLTATLDKHAWMFGAQLN
ncbi:Dps family protein [Candidatus Protofrankia californiensis]|uniref:Dps family protein n=1 Tax=Candidatus Protofrankia californiensis TaxID=1839754 RepID=UPI001041486F|nr:DNA starvation/stationary phase protection protein [Candidatus Protofrankia californiensis]